MESRRIEIDLEKYKTELKNEYPFLEDKIINEFILYWNDFLQEYYFLFIEKEIY
jgi:hypothetical protein